MPLTRIRTNDLLSGSVSSGTLNVTAITDQSAATSPDDNDLILIYDDGASALRKMTRGNFTAGLSTTLSGAYDSGRIITASNGPVDIQRTTNNTSATTLLKLAVSGSVSSAGVAGPEIQFGIPVNGNSELGGAIRCTKWSAGAGDSFGELQFLVTGDDEVLDRILKIDYTGVAVQGLGSSEVFPSNGYAFMVAASGETNAMVVEQTTGDVGIGLTNPLVPLHVYRSNTSTAPQVSAQQGSTGDAGYFFSIPNCSYMMGIDNSDADKFKIAYGSSSDNATLGTSSRFAIDATGRVGIGQTAPSAFFEIKNISLDPADDFGDTSNYQMYIRGNYANNDYMGIALGSSNNAGAAILHQDLGGFSKGDLVFMTKESALNGVAPAERMRITSTGDVVVLGSLLKITSTEDAAIFLEADTDNSTKSHNPFVKFSQDNTLVQSIIGLCGATDKDPENNTYTGVVDNNMLIGTTTNYGLQLGTNDNVRMTIENGGNIKLVSTKDDTTASSANLFINSSTGFLARSTSDRRQKKNITEISSSLDNLCALIPRHFYDINDENNEIKIAGFVADEVQAVFPALVPERDDPNEIYRSVAYDRLGAYIVSAIKELKLRIETLENRS